MAAGAFPGGAGNGGRGAVGSPLTRTLGSAGPGTVKGPPSGPGGDCRQWLGSLGASPCHAQSTHLRIYPQALSGGTGAGDGQTRSGGRGQFGAAGNCSGRLKQSQGKELTCDVIPAMIRGRGRRKMQG